MQHKVLRHAGLTLCVLTYAVVPLCAHASLNDDQRRALAHSFVDKLRGFYSDVKKADQKKSGGLSDIPDGQELLLQPYLLGLPFSDNVYGIKHDNKAYLSFQNFVDVLYFSIKYDNETHDAEGWFLREDWHFSMDYAAHKVISKGKTYTIGDDNTYMKDGELFVTTDALKLWFDIGIDPNLMSQTLFLKSDYPFPVQAHKRRQDRDIADRRNSNIPQYPLIDTEYKWLDVKSAQISASSTYRSQPDEPGVKRTNGNAVVQGQALKQSMYAAISADDQNKISGISGQLFKESLKPDLLGPLKARAYYVGDVSQTAIPLTPSGRQGLGANVTNLPVYERYDLSSTAIRGNATPGWDVELYRNNGLVSSQTIGDEGRYDFEDVQLFAGNNDFELLFFGPQGEIRRETVNLPVDQDVIAQKDNTYEFAATFDNTQLYRKIPTNRTDDGELHVSGRYNFLVGDVLNYVGFRNLSVGGENKSYLSSGLTTTALSTIIDADVTVDEKGESKAGLQLRHDFGKIDTLLGAQVATNHYIISEDEIPVVRSVDAALQMPIPFLPGNKNTFSLTGSHGETADKRAEDTASAALGSQYGGLNVTQALSYRADTDSEPKQSYDPSVSGRVGKFYWRADGSYEMKPEPGLNLARMDVKYQHNEKWSGDLSVERQPQDNLTQYQLGANWNNDKFVLTPFINYDSEHELYTGVNVRFGLVNPPGDEPLVMTGRSISGQGFVNAFVYLDKDGDLKFDGQDEPLEGVLVKSINVARREKTNDKGVALLTAIPSNRQTDINLDPNTLPDPFMISKFEPRSVALKPGEIISLEMPVQYAGEMDGVMQLAKHGGTVRDFIRSRLSLLPLENDLNSTMQSEAVSDGFFVFSLIPPGRYFLVANADDAQDYKARRPQPRLITIGYDAPELYGQDILISESNRDIGFKVLSEDDALALGFAPVADRRKAAPQYLISIEKESGSKLLNLLYAFNAKKMASQYLSDLQKLEGVDANGNKSQRYFVASLDQAYERCTLIADEGLPCTVEALLPPSEGFAVRRKGIMTTDNSVQAPVIPEKL